MIALLYFIVISIVIGTLSLCLSQIDFIFPYWNLTYTYILEGLAITAISTLVLTLSALGARYYIRSQLVKIFLLCSVLLAFYLVVVLNIINNAIYILGFFIGIFIASLIILKTIEKNHKKIASLADDLNIESTHDVVDLETYLERVAKFKSSKNSSLIGIECFDYTIKVEDYLKLIPALYNYLHNSDLSAINDLSALRAQVKLRDLSNPFNQDFLHLLNYILISKNFLWEYESKWLQLKSRSQMLNSTTKVRRKFSLFKKNELKKPLELEKDKSKSLANNKHDSLIANIGSFFHEGKDKDLKSNLDEEKEKYGTVDNAMISMFMKSLDYKDSHYEAKAQKLLNDSLEKDQTIDLNPTPNLPDNSNSAHKISTYESSVIIDGVPMHEIHYIPTQDATNIHERQAQLIQKEMGIRPSLLGELKLDGHTIKLSDDFNFDNSFELYFRSYYRDMSLRVFAFFQFLSHTSKTKFASAHHHISHHKGFTTREVGVSSLALNGALYLNRMPLNVELLKPLVFMLFMAGSIYLFMSKMSLSAFISYNGGYSSAYSILQGMHCWAIVLFLLLASNSALAVISCFNKAVMRLTSEIYEAARILKFLVAAITVSITLAILWPGQLISTVKMIHSDLAQIENNELSYTSGYVNNRLFNERLSIGVVPKLYALLSIPVIGPRTGNKWVKLYLPAEHDLIISPHERLQVENRFTKQKRLHTRNVPRWLFKHTKNFKFIVEASKVDSTFVNKNTLDPIFKKMHEKANETYIKEPQ